MRIHALVWAAALAFSSQFALAQDQSPGTDGARANAKLLASQPNGCGSGWSVYLVPDSVPLVACTFRAACDEHDDCYGKCEGRIQDATAPQCEYLRCRKGGDLFSSPRCKTDANLLKLKQDAQKRRNKCDDAIGTKIREINAGTAVCEAFAYVYVNAVKRFGDPFFQGIRPASTSNDQPKTEYDRAIRDFFRKGTQEEFEAFNAQPPKFDAPLKYEPGLGLVNIPGKIVLER